jgi:hypothetical protein
LDLLARRGCDEDGHHSNHSKEPTMTIEAHTIGGVEFELVRVKSPVPYWRVKTIENDHLFEAGCFPKNRSRPALLEELEYAFKRAGSTAEFRRRLSLP